MDSSAEVKVYFFILTKIISCKILHFYFFSVNISRWLNNNSIDFCILSQYNRTQLSTCKGKRVVESMKPLGRPKKPIEELKTPRP